ncbi:acyl carrier protein [Lachnospiraceae bacterium]|nr:acyl carrier protein [Lachnospiraceae bacterium]MCI9059680.1 acyl carrier protein [Lachnospiraceae bacterium]GFI29463.1 acyl carrier protein [Lachnospiraceae bacterium]
MDRKELETQVLNMVAASYKQEAANLSMETLFKEDLGGASVQMVALVAEIENELDVELMLADASGCATIGDLVNLIEEEM